MLALREVPTVVRLVRCCTGFAVFLTLGWTVLAVEPDLSGYVTVEKAVAAKPGKTTVLADDAQPAFLGVSVTAGSKGQLTITEVAGESPAARAGVLPGDRLRKLDGKELTEETFGELLRTKSPGDTVKLSLLRKDKPLDSAVTLTALSAPLPLGRQRAMLGVQVEPVKDGSGVRIELIVPGSSAEKAKLKAGEVILKVDQVEIGSADKLGEVLSGHKPNDVVTLTLLLAEKPVELKVKLGAEPVSQGGRRGFDFRTRYWTKPIYRLGIICIEYPDVKHNSKVSPKAWEESMFSRGTYTKTSPTGQTVHGSLADYYHEQSHGTLKVEGKVFDYVTVSKNRGEYATGNRQALLTEAVDKLLDRDGKDALKNIDGIVFLYAGGRYRAARGSLYWPHRSSFTHKDRRWPYFICEEGGQRMNSISVFCHEFGHMLGLPDLYARPENPGEEGAGIWCAMANEAGNGRPQHFCAWSKEKLGWIKPTVIDPTVKQKLILAPVEDSPNECFKILVRPDGSEYFLLENRKKKGFDASLPADGLLICAWSAIGRSWKNRTEWPAPPARGCS